jgi:D-threonate/D-erythronate kinase
MAEGSFEIGVLSDDLAGALASAARLRANGLRTQVIWNEIEVPATADALVVDMRTRDRADAPESHARRWAAYLRTVGCRRFELRTDSTLRGSPAAELRGMLEGLEVADPWVLAVPAFPEAGRVTLGGQQRVHGGPDIPVAARVFGSSAVTTIDRDCIEAGGEKVVDAVLGSSRQGISNFVADAVNDRHLATLAEVVGVIEDDDVDLITVSPGAWLKYHPARVISRPRFVLVVLSSATDQNHRQLERLVSTMPCRVLDPSRATADPVELPGTMATTPRVVVLETITFRRGLEASDTSLSIAAAKSAALVLDTARSAGSQCVGVVVSGGFTAACLVDELAAAGARAREEVEPLCGAGSLLGGGWDGLPLMTKGGLVGDDSTLTGLVTALWDGWANG